MFHLLFLKFFFEPTWLIWIVSQKAKQNKTKPVQFCVLKHTFLDIYELYVIILKHFNLLLLFLLLDYFHGGVFPMWWVNGPLGGHVVCFYLCEFFEAGLDDASRVLFYASVFSLHCHPCAFKNPAPGWLGLADHSGKYLFPIPYALYRSELSQRNTLCVPLSQPCTKKFFNIFPGVLDVLW